MDKIRTNQQNKALHVFFNQVKNTLDEHGVTLHQFLDKFKEEDVQVSGDNVKAVWKKILERKYYKDTTTEMTNKELQDIYQEFNLKIGELIGEDLGFPSNEVIQLLKWFNTNK
jgi:uncharacterized membrane protein YqiK